MSEHDQLPDAAIAPETELEGEYTHELDPQGDGGDEHAHEQEHAPKKARRMPFALRNAAGVPKWKRETRFGVAALLSFVILVSVLLVNKGTKKGTKPPSMAIASTKAPTSPSSTEPSDESDPVGDKKSKSEKTQAKPKDNTSEPPSETVTPPDSMAPASDKLPPEDSSPPLADTNLQDAGTEAILPAGPDAGVNPPLPPTALGNMSLSGADGADSALPLPATTASPVAADESAKNLPAPPQPAPVPTPASPLDSAPVPAPATVAESNLVPSSEPKPQTPATDLATQAPVPDLAGATEASAPTPDLAGATEAPAPTPNLAGATEAPASTPDLAGATEAPAPTPGLAGATEAPAPMPNLAGATEAPAPTPDLAGATEAPAPTQGLAAANNTPLPDTGASTPAAAPPAQMPDASPPAQAAVPPAPAADPGSELPIPGAAPTLGTGQAGMVVAPTPAETGTPAVRATEGVPDFAPPPSSDDAMAVSTAPPEIKPGEGIPIPNAGKGRSLEEDLPLNGAPATAVAGASLAAGAGAGVVAAKAETETEAAGLDPLTPELHVVQSGENFWTISKYYYSSGRYYMALWKANSRTVSAPDQLMVGQTIVIPPPEALDRKSIDPPGKTSSSSSRTSTPVRRTSRSKPKEEEATNSVEQPTSEVELILPIDNSMISRRSRSEPMEEVDPPPGKRYQTSRPRYRVRAHETLRSIARDTLNDARRADEIYDLNRDILNDDPRNLVEGQILELPEEARVGRDSR